MVVLSMLLRVHLEISEYILEISFKEAEFMLLPEEIRLAHNIL